MDCDTVIIGSGPAGLTAGIYCVRGGLTVKLFAGSLIGGQLTTTSIIENFPGFPDGIYGGDLMGNMMAQFEGQGGEVIFESVELLSRADAKHFSVKHESGEVLCKNVIIATGTATRWLGVEGEKELIGKGISACAVCDGSFYKDKVVGVVGGGDSACEEALYLSHITKKVYMFVRKTEMRASAVMRVKVENTPNIEVLYETSVRGFSKSSSGHLSGVLLSNGDSLVLDGLFVAIGRVPNTSFIDGSLKHIVVDGYIPVNRYGATTVRGIFAAGDVTNKDLNQGIIAAGQGAIAGLSSIRNLS